MTDLNIPNLNMKSDKYIFKKKISLRRKSKRRLFIESALMFIFSLLLVYINFLIPNKNLLLQNIPTTLKKSMVLINDLFLNLYELLMVIFIFVTLFTALILLIGSFYRLYRVSKKSINKSFINKF